MNGFCQQALDITACILDAMKGAFDMLTNTAQEPVKFGWILEGLVGPLTCPDTVARLLTHLGLPLVANKALVTEDVAIPYPLQDHLSRISLIVIAAHQIVN